MGLLATQEGGVPLQVFWDKRKAAYVCYGRSHLRGGQAGHCDAPIDGLLDVIRIDLSSCD